MIVSQVKISLKRGNIPEASSGEEITCTRETGKYEPAFLAICQETRAFSSGTGMQKMTIPTSAEKVRFAAILCIVSV